MTTTEDLTDDGRIKVEYDEVNGHERVSAVHIGDATHSSLNDYETQKQVQKVTDTNPLLADAWREVVKDDGHELKVARFDERGGAQIEVEEV
jgi:hypothetical protein